MKYFCAVIFILLFHIGYSTNEVIYLWSGGLTDTSVNINAKLTDSTSAARLILSTNPQFTSPLFSAYYHVDSTTNMMVAMTISGLTQDTKYYYAVESDGIADTSADDIGSFKTFHTGYFSYYFTTGSCCLYSDHVVYDVMSNCNPLFCVVIGDLHYANPNSATDINVHRSPYETQVLSKPRAAAFYKKVPFEYVWDDHDFCGNDCDSSYVGKVNARQAYREYVPHYPLPAGTGNNAIYQTFTVGRVRYIHTDLRSDRYGTSMMGAQQKTWFKNECIIARDSNQIICWISSVTWNGNLNDNWGGYQAERMELSNFFRDNSIVNMFILCGDAHMLAIDDGSHGDFSNVLSNPYQYPIFNAAALNMTGGYKGGTFSEGGVFPNPSYNWGQFGIVTVNDTGGSSICIDLNGYRTDSIADQITLVNHYSFCRNLGPSWSGIPIVSIVENYSKVFPNPNEGEFVFQTSLELINPQISIVDCSGRNVNMDYTFAIERGEIKFDVRKFTSGIYFVKIIEGKQIQEKKIVIINQE